MTDMQLIGVFLVLLGFAGISTSARIARLERRVKAVEDGPTKDEGWDQ